MQRGGMEYELPVFLKFWERAHRLVEIWPISERMSLDRQARVETNVLFLEVSTLPWNNVVYYFHITASQFIKYCLIHNLIGLYDRGWL